MPQPKIKAQLRKFHPEATVPEYKSPGAAAFDLHACLPVEQIIPISPGETVAIPTGVGIYLGNPDYCLEIWERSGLGKQGVERRGGLVDSDYQGEIMVMLTNGTNAVFRVGHGYRIAQAKVAPVQRVTFNVVDNFSEATERGSKGFGSTGS